MFHGNKNWYPIKKKRPLSSSPSQENNGFFKAMKTLLNVYHEITMNFTK